MPKKRKEVIRVNSTCEHCKGAGIVKPRQVFSKNVKDPKGHAKLCGLCKGKGYRELSLEYLPFTGKKHMGGVQTVHGIGHNFTFHDPEAGSISYEDFLKGKRPGKSVDRK